MSVKGSSEAPKRFFSLRQPFATPRINPAERLKHTTILSASARLYVRRTSASVSNIAISIKGEERSRPRASPRNEVEDPTECEADDDELGEDFQPVKPAFARRVFGHRAKHHRGQRRKQAHHEKMSHECLPAAMSKASSIVR